MLNLPTFGGVNINGFRLVGIPHMNCPFLIIQDRAEEGVVYVQALNILRSDLSLSDGST